MDNVVRLAIISNAFWLTVFLCCIIFFRSEIRALLNSLSSVSVAGSHFELGDKSQTLKSYTILSNIFLDLLCNSLNREKFVEVFSEVNAQQLTKFTIKYLMEAPKEDINFLLMRNVAYIAGRRGRVQDALALYQLLFDKAPTDMILRHDMGVFLFDKNPSEAKKIYLDLMNENPGTPVYRYNYALCNIQLDDFENGIADLKSAIKSGYSDPEMIKRPAIYKLAIVKPDEYKNLLALEEEEKQKRQNFGLPVTQADPE